MLEASKSSSNANGKLMASVSSGVISASHLITRKSFRSKEQFLQQRSVPSYPQDEPISRGAAHNTCKLRRREPQYPRCRTVNEFERRSCLGATIAHVWLLLGKPSKNFVGIADDVVDFISACGDLTGQQSEHVRCLLLRSSAFHFQELLEFVPSACECGAARAQPHTLFLSDSKSTGGKERVWRSVSSLEQMSAMTSSHSIQSVPAALKPEASSVPPSVSRRSVLNSFLSKRMAKPASNDASDRPHEPAFTNNGGKRIWSRAVKTNAGTGQTLKATGSLPPNRNFRI